MEIWGPPWQYNSVGYFFGIKTWRKITQTSICLPSVVLTNLLSVLEEPMDAYVASFT